MFPRTNFGSDDFLSMLPPPGLAPPVLEWRGVHTVLRGRSAAAVSGALIDGNLMREVLPESWESRFMLPKALASSSTLVRREEEGEPGIVSPLFISSRRLSCERPAPVRRRLATSAPAPLDCDSNLCRTVSRDAPRSVVPGAGTAALPLERSLHMTCAVAPWAASHAKRLTHPP